VVTPVGSAFWSASVLLKVINKPYKQLISMVTTVCNVYVTTANTHST
jgi:hypothetical protein